MSPTDIAAIITTIATVLAGVTAMIHFIVKHYLSELKPNSGSSMRDSISRLETQSNQLSTRVDKIYEILTDKG